MPVCFNIKGTVSRDEYENRNSTFCVGADDFHNFVKKSQIKFLFASMKSLIRTYCENPSSNPIQEACYGFPIFACDSKSCFESRLWSWKLFWKPAMNVCTLGGFNVSNLMGIKRRMIDIGKKNNYLLFAKCLKMYNFFAFAFKSFKKCYYDRKKKFSWKISISVTKKCRILCWFQIRWCRFKQMPLSPKL